MPITLKTLRRAIRQAKPLSWYRAGRTVTVDDRMQEGYEYELTEDPGENFPDDFAPFHDPGEMLALGVFEGKYCNDCTDELPREWFERALEAGSLRPGRPSVEANLLGVGSRQPLRVWREKGWLHGPDVRGWFQWYCRYWLGRRLPEVDAIQIKRWRAFRRHAAQIAWSYERMDRPPTTDEEKRGHRARQRQALLQWGYNPFM